MCYVFGCGPSLAGYDCDKLARGGVTICCNASIMALKRCDYFLFCDPRVKDEAAYYRSAFKKARTVVLGNQELYELCIRGTKHERRRKVVVPSAERAGHDCSAHAVQLIGGEDATHVATHLGLIMGCSPIVLVGVDLEWGAEKYFHSRADKDLWPSLGSEDDQATDESLKRAYGYWCKVKADNPGLPILVANKQSRLCGLYGWADLSRFLKRDGDRQ